MNRGKIFVGGHKEKGAYGHIIRDQRAVINSFLVKNLRERGYFLEYESRIHQATRDGSILAYPKEIRYAVSGNMYNQEKYHLPRAKEALLDGRDVYIDKTCFDLIKPKILRDTFFHSIEFSIASFTDFTYVNKPTNKSLEILLSLFMDIYHTKMFKESKIEINEAIAELKDNPNTYIGDMEKVTSVRLDVLYYRNKILGNKANGNNIFNKIYECINELKDME